MLKRIRYNQMKRIRFIVSIFIFAAYMLLFLCTNFYPQYESAIQAFIISALSVHIIISALFLHKTITKKQCFEDELSKDNDKQAAYFTLHIFLFILLAIPLALYSLKLSIPINIDMSFIIYMALVALNDGFYLCLERKDISYAEINDEN